MREGRLDRAIMSIGLFIAGVAFANDLAENRPVGLTLLLSAIIWLRVQYPPTTEDKGREDRA